MTEHVIPIMASCFLLAVSAQEPAPVRDERCKSALVTADLEEITGSVKPMNAVNNGPVKSNRGTGNLELWKELKIPFARNHDASFHAVYGGEHVVDVHAIFRDFSKDPYDPASYDFTLTDEYLATIQEGGTKVFYRLGSTIEHAKKKYGTRVPPDFKKWAVICEHIIRHYTEGWADGYRWDIKYWEIWNEPDLSSGKADKKTWQGTDEQFFAFYRIVALHLKKRFPKLKIGGPSLAGDISFMKRFLAEMTSKERVPLDFFSWHCYTALPEQIGKKALEIRSMLDHFGYRDTESILNEWNYNRGWTGKDYLDSTRTIFGLKGAVFTASVMSICQQAPVDMLMYYDASPCAYNGLFDFYLNIPRKSHYTFLAWSKLAELQHEIVVNTPAGSGLYATAATDKKRKFGLLLSYYCEAGDLPEEQMVTIKVNGTSLWGVRLYCLDETKDFTEGSYQTTMDGHIRFPMKTNTLVFLEK